MGNCLKRLAELNLKAKAEKCSFLQSELKFYGLIFSASGTRPDPERIDNLVKVSAPRNVSEVRSFLGMTNTCHDYIPDYATIAAPLRQLTRKNVTFEWKLEHQRAFDKMKKALTQTPVMAYFDTSKRTMVIVDGSPFGLGAILAQRERQGQQYNIIAYASRPLTPVERRYSQTDIEGLSLVWGIEHFRLFLIGSEFDVITDHKALESTFNNPKSKPPARIERWMMRLQPYNYKVIYKKGSLDESDYMSRHPVSGPHEISDEGEIAEAYVNFIVNHAVPKSMTLNEIQEETIKDPTLTKVRESLISGKWDNKDKDIQPFIKCANELTINKSQNIILKGARIVIPKALQDTATKLAHVGHQGIEKTKSLLREKIWYPNIDAKVQEIVEKCVPCQAVGQKSPPEPMEITPTPDTPWSSLAMDFYGPIPNTGQYLLVLIDIYSKFPEIEIVNSTEAKACIPKLDKIFATYGIPAKLKSDNGPPFNGKEFENYMTALGIEWKPSTPLWPQGNANVESIMRPIGKVMKTSLLEGKNWRQELQRFLLNYCSTPHKTTGVAPCELLFNRQIQGQLPQLQIKNIINKHREAKQNVERKKEENKIYYDMKKRAKYSDIKVGDTVICMQKKSNKLTPRFSPEMLTVTERSGSKVTAERQGKCITRDVSHFKKIVASDSEDDWDNQHQVQHQPELLIRRSERRRVPVHKYGQPIPSGLVNM